MKKLILFLAITTSAFCEDGTKPSDYFSHSGWSDEASKIEVNQNVIIQMLQPFGQEVYQIYDSVGEKKLIGIIVYDRKNKRWICKEVNE